MSSASSISSISYIFSGMSIPRFLSSMPSFDACGTSRPIEVSSSLCANTSRVLPSIISLPPFITETLRLALPVLGKKLKGYDDPDALLIGVETRSSSPVRLVRDDNYEANIRGIYPCGEGAGYAGGIMSAAVDGMRVAEAVLIRRGMMEE